MSQQMDKLILEANSEIQGLQDKLQSMQVEQTNLEHKNRELIDAFREKSKTQQQIQKLYQSLKAQVMASQVATAATDEAENTIHTASRDRFVDRIPGARSGLQQRFNQFSVGYPGSRRHDRQGSGSSGGNDGRANETRNIGLGSSWNNHAQNVRSWTAQSAPASNTPSQHRSRLPVVAQTNIRGNTILSADTGSQFRSTHSTRQTPNGFNSNTLCSGGGGGGGYGFATGMKVGKQQPDGLLNRPTPRRMR